MSTALGTHEDYRLHEWEWTFAWISFQGGRIYNSPPIPYWEFDTLQTRLRSTVALDPRDLSMLERHPREDDDDFWSRRKRAVYTNLIKPIVRSRVGWIMRHEVARPIAPWLADYYADVDLAGTGRESFMAQGLTYASPFGHAFCETQIPALPGGLEANSAAEARDLGQRPYSVWYSPLDVMDWQMNDRGEYDWIVLRSRRSEGRRPGAFAKADAAQPVGSAAQIVTTYRIWFPDHFEDWEARSDGGVASPAGATNTAGMRPTATPILAREGPNPIGRVPVDVLYNLRDPMTRGVGVSATLDASYLNRCHYNLMSWRDDQLANQTFAQLAIPGPKGKVTALQLGTSRYIGYDPGAGGGMPGYFAPPTAPTQLLGDVAKDIAIQLREVASMSRGQPEQSIQPRAADALAMERIDLENELAEAAREAEAFEARNLRTVAMWSGHDPASLMVEYRKPGSTPTVALSMAGIKAATNGNGTPLPGANESQPKENSDGTR